MASFRPFAALRPQAELAPRVCAPPYDVMTDAEARGMASADALSFVTVSRPEVALPEGSSSKSAEAYAAGRSAFDRLIRNGTLVLDSSPRYYLYRQSMAGHSQTGIVGLASCEEYANGSIRKHELTRVEKEDDRVRHMNTLGAQTGPVFLFHPTDANIAALISKITETSPEIDFVARDGVRHSAWAALDPGDAKEIEQSFANMPALYIADGHHRSAAAARVWEEQRDNPAAQGFLSVVFAADALRILPYNRVVKGLHGNSPEGFLRRLAECCEPTSATSPKPANKGEFALFLNGKWSSYQFRSELSDGCPAAEKLDVALLQKHVLKELLGIDDPRTSDRIDFVGGVRGTEALEAMVQRGDHSCAFSMFPTQINELMEVADAGAVMPPKSTWFEPKLRDAMFCHMLESAPR